MNISRNEVSTFNYSSASAVAAEVVIPVGTASAGLNKKIRITDLKLSGGATRAAFVLSVPNHVGAGKALNFTIASSDNVNYTWEIPYEFNIVSGTTTANNLVASAGATGINYCIAGYIEK